MARTLPRQPHWTIGGALLFLLLLSLSKVNKLLGNHREIASSYQMVLGQPPQEESQGQFTYLRPHWDTLQEFLDRCEAFHDEGSPFEAAPTTLLKPIQVFFSRPPSANMLEFQTAVEALNGYETLKKEKAHPMLDGSPLPCLPMAPDPTVKPLRHRPTRIAVLTVATQNNKNLFGDEYDSQARAQYDRALSMSLNEKKNYCDRHGYDFHVVTETVEGRNSGWYRIPAALALMGLYDWVFYMDLDTVILNHSVKLEEFLDPRYNVVIGVDENGINDGVFFMRSSTWTRFLLIEAWTLTNEPYTHLWFEQAALMRLATLHGVRNRMKMVPQRHFNSYIKGSAYPSDKGEATFIVHFAGRGEDKWELVEKFNLERDQIEKDKLERVAALK